MQPKEQLLKWNIHVPSTCSTAVLKSLYLESLSHRSKPAPNHVSDTAVSATDAIKDQNSGHENNFLQVLRMM